MKSLLLIPFLVFLSPAQTTKLTYTSTVKMEVLPSDSFYIVASGEVKNTGDSTVGVHPYISVLFAGKEDISTGTAKTHRIFPGQSTSFSIISKRYRYSPALVKSYSWRIGFK